MLGMHEAWREAFRAKAQAKVWISAKYIDAATGASVASLTDRVGEGYGNGAVVAPTMQHSPRRALVFATDKGLRSDNPIDFSGDPAVYAFLAAVSDDTAGSKFWYELTANAYTAVGGFCCSLQAAYREDANHCGRKADTSVGRSEWLVGPGLTAGSLYLFGSEFDYSKASGSEIVIRRNGALPAVTQYAFAELVDTGHANDVLNIGCRDVDGAPGAYAALKLSELYITLGPLTAAQRACIEAEIKAAWGIS